MCDAGVGQHTLDAALHKRQDVATHNGQDGNGPDERRPVSTDGPEYHIEDSRKGDEGSGFGCHGHKGRNWRWRAVVHVWRPRLEWYRRHLKSETNYEKSHGDEQQI